MSLQKKDFIEIDFTGRVKNGEVFDSTEKKELEKLHQGHDHPIEAKPFAFCLGEGMFLKSIDEFLIGKDVGKRYDVELTPEHAFGKRNPEFVQMIPLKIFKEKNVMPRVGENFNFDGKIAKVLSVSGGRVTVDFNHFLSGKTVEYSINVIRKITDQKEKINSLNEFFFRQDFLYTIENKKLILEVQKPLVNLVELFKDKYKEIIGLELEIKEIDEKSSPTESQEPKEDIPDMVE